MQMQKQQLVTMLQVKSTLQFKMTQAFHNQQKMQLLVLKQTEQFTQLMKHYLQNLQIVLVLPLDFESRIICTTKKQKHCAFVFLFC